jgi:triphosphoribosyl-dephospho-CoA synthase
MSSIPGTGCRSPSAALGTPCSSLPIGLCAQLACIWEATARKPGNVHRFRDFEDCSYLDFLVSAAALAPVLDSAPQRPVGATVLEAVRATRRVAGNNTNLGIVLLLAPLAAVPMEEELRSGLARVLDGLDLADTRAVYQAIRLAAPGGLGRVAQEDVHGEPSQNLRAVMALAAERDLVARQYANGFREVFDEGVPALRLGLERPATLEAAIIRCQLQLLANHADSLIARKQGTAEALEASRQARAVLDAGWPTGSAGAAALAEFDAWLRAVGHSRNPGTTADLVTACLFVALRQHMLTLPLPIPWSAGADHG